MGNIGEDEEEVEVMPLETPLPEELPEEPKVPAEAEADNGFYVGEGACVSSQDWRDYMWRYSLTGMM